jgi:hypothetical protein
MTTILTRAAPWLALLIVLALLALVFLAGAHGGHPLAGTHFYGGHSR